MLFDVDVSLLRRSSPEFAARKRSLFNLHCSAPQETDHTDTTHEGMKVILHPGASSTSSGYQRPKRGRTEDDIVPVDPTLLRQRSTQSGAEIKDPAPSKSWKLMRVAVQHRGGVRCIAVDPANDWFATGANDSRINVWDVAKGNLRLVLTGHKEAVRGLAVSCLSPYMFSCSDDHTVKCWDLERNQIIRDFHGHSKAVTSVAAHPSLDVVISGGGDATVRVWDLRTRTEVHVLRGHTDSVLCVAAQSSEPQVLSGGADCFVYLWDLAAGKPMTRLTRHKKPVRALAVHPIENTFVSCGTDNIRKWRLPLGEFMCNMRSTTSIEGNCRWSCASCSARDVLCVGSEDGALRFFQWQANLPFQQLQTKALPGSLECETVIHCCTFDRSGTRLMTGEGDSSVKTWKEVE